mmetsp:Transcript_15812/g.34358  ORF Transcript_15812/g.34358 Transcript_15812/m.34358 type:complete len:286 (-) Transcript_15812:356-1213(-)
MLNFSIPRLSVGRLLAHSCLLLALLLLLLLLLLLFLLLRFLLLRLLFGLLLLFLLFFVVQLCLGLRFVFIFVFFFLIFFVFLCEGLLVHELLPHGGDVNGTKLRQLGHDDAWIEIQLLLQELLDIDLPSRCGQRWCCAAQMPFSSIELLDGVLQTIPKVCKMRLMNEAHLYGILQSRFDCGPTHRNSQIGLRLQKTEDQELRRKQSSALIELIRRLARVPPETLGIVGVVDGFLHCGRLFLPLLDWMAWHMTASMPFHSSHDLGIPLPIRGVLLVVVFNLRCRDA